MHRREPEPSGTHWYTTSCTGGTVASGWGQATSRADGTYYNTDFLTPARTDVRQSVTIQYSIYDTVYLAHVHWAHTDSGEASGLIYGEISTLGADTCK